MNALWQVPHDKHLSHPMLTHFVAVIQHSSRACSLLTSILSLVAFVLSVVFAWHTPGVGCRVCLKGGLLETGYSPDTPQPVSSEHVLLSVASASAAGRHYFPHSRRSEKISFTEGRQYVLVSLVGIVSFVTCWPRIDTTLSFLWSESIERDRSVWKSQERKVKKKKLLACLLSTRNKVLLI